MSEVHVEEHSTPIKTPQQLIVVVVAAFLVPVLLIVMITRLVTGGLQIDMGSPAMSKEAVAKRLKPVGEVALAETSPASQAETQGTVDGAQVYLQACGICHAAGLAGAPKLGDNAAWKSRLTQGAALLHDHAINGIRAMPARGGNTALSDAAVKAAVDYMIGQSK